MIVLLRVVLAALLAIASIPALAGPPAAISPAVQYGPNGKIAFDRLRHWLPNISAVGQAMASPPTIVSGTSSSMSSGILRPLTSEDGSWSQTYQSGDWFTSLGIPFAGNYLTTSVSPLSYGGNSVHLAWIWEGSEFELAFVSNTQGFLVKIDDQYVSLTPQASVGGGTNYFKYTFPSSARHRIEVLCAGCTMSSVKVGATDTLTPAPVRGPKVIAVGDSFTGTLVNSTGRSWVVALMDRLQWDNVLNSGVGGTGYVAGGGSLPYVQFTAALNNATSGTLTANFTGTTGSNYNVIFGDGQMASGATLTNGSTAVSWTSGPITTSTITNVVTSANATFGQRLQHDVLQHKPEVALFVGSVNDRSYPPGVVAARAKSAWQAAAAAGAVVIAVPTASAGAITWTAGQIAVKAAMKDACLSMACLWIDPLEMPVTAAGANGSGYLTSAASVGATVLPLSCAGPSNADCPQPGSTIELGSGANLERIHLKMRNTTAGFCGTYGGNGAWCYNWDFDGALKYAHTAGEAWRRVGGAYITGRGNAGATTGWGNSDRYNSSDNVHPTPAGHVGLGNAIADLLIVSTAPN